MTEKLHFAFLGDAHVMLGTVPVSGFVSSKAHALLCYLAATGRSHTRTALAALFWADLPEDAAATNLRQVLSNLKRLLEPYLLITRQTVAFNTGAPYLLDTEVFTEELRILHMLERSSSLSRVLPPDQLLSLRQAVDLYRGDFLQGLRVRDAPMFEEWVLVQQERFREFALRMLHLLAYQCMVHGDFGAALDFTSRELALDLWREEAHRQMMLLLARTGRHAAALAQYERCRKMLWDELGVEPMPETTALYERIRTAQSIRRPPLPSQPTSFIGRERERLELAERFSDPAYRLLTIVGPGGIGKTRLALQVASDLEQRFLHGSVFVPLAAVSSAGLLVPTIAAALNLGLRGTEEPTIQLINYLREKEMLLVLDNFEHLVESGSDLLFDLVQQAPELRLLVTSRERLSLQEEWLLPIAGLSVPSSVNEKDLEAYDAVAVFMESVQRINVPLDLEHEDDRACVVRICRLLEGLPLGLELAAASLRVLTCAELARELEHNLDLLHSTLRNVPERQRSLRATFEYSWNLLSAQEQDVYARLCVFHGGFQRVAAAQVAGAPLPLLQALVDKSLLRCSPEGRYDLHPVLRQYAEQKLNQTSQSKAETHSRHCNYYTSFLQRQQKPLMGSHQPIAMLEIGEEIENVRGAWQWAVRQHRLDALAQSAESLYQWYRIHGLSNEGIEMFEQSVDALACEPSRDPGKDLLLGKLLIRLGMLYVGPSCYAEAGQVCERALSLLRPLADLQEIAFALHLLSLIERSTGDYAAAERHYRESLEMRETIGDRSGVATCLLGLAGIAYYRGDYQGATRLAQQGLPIARQLGDQKQIADFLVGLGLLAVTQGAHETAQQRLQESLVIAKSMADREGMIMCLTGLGKIARALDTFDEANRLCQESLLLCQEIGYRIGVQDNLDTLGRIALAQQDYAQARQWFQQGLVVADAASDQAGKAIAQASLGEVAYARSDYSVAERRLLQALALARAIERTPVVLMALVGLGRLFVKTGRPTQALEILSVTLDHPALEDSSREQVEQLRVELDALVTPEQIAAVKASATAVHFDDTVTTLLRGRPIPIESHPGIGS